MLSALNLQINPQKASLVNAISIGNLKTIHLSQEKLLLSAYSSKLTWVKQPLLIRNLRNIKLRRTHMNLVYKYYNSTKKTKQNIFILFYLLLLLQQNTKVWLYIIAKP